MPSQDDHREKAVEWPVKIGRCKNCGSILSEDYVSGGKCVDRFTNHALEVFTVEPSDPHLKRMHFEERDDELDLPQLRSELQRLAEGRMTLDSTELLTWAEGWLLTLSAGDADG